MSKEPHSHFSIVCAVSVIPCFRNSVSAPPGPSPYIFSIDVLLCCRTAQALELGQFVGASKKSALSVVMGDFNSTPNSAQMRAVLGLGGLTDSYAEMHPSVAPDSGERHTFTPKGKT